MMVRLRGEGGEWVAFDPELVEAILFHDGKVKILVSGRELFMPASEAEVQKILRLYREIVIG